MKTIYAEDTTRPGVNVKVQARNTGDERVDIGPTELDPGETWETEEHNLVVTDGLTYEAERLGGESTQFIDHIAVGSDETDTTLSMSGLQGTEHHREQIPAGDISHPNPEETQYEMVIDTTEPGSQPVDIAEIGLFAEPQGDPDDFMYARVTVASFEKTSDIEVRIFYTVGYSNP